MKIEPKDPKEEFQVRVLEFSENKENTYEKFKTYDLNMKKSATIERENHPFTKEIGLSIAKHLKKLGSLTKLLEKIVVQQFNEAELPNLFVKIDAAQTGYDSLMLWAIRLGYFVEEPIVLEEPNKKKESTLWPKVQERNLRRLLFDVHDPFVALAFSFR